MNKRYTCEQACFLGGKRYEVGDDLVDGVEPNSHFRDNKTGERAKPRKTEVLLTKNAEVNKTVENLDEINQKIENIKADSEKQLNEFKLLVGEHLAKFEKRIEELETIILEGKEAGGKEPEVSAEMLAKQAPNKNSVK